MLLRLMVNMMKFIVIWMGRFAGTLMGYHQYFGMFEGLFAPPS
ncbi:MAG: hypothetical protein ACTS44_01175 [Candidatus Hodgkinia cicadicola]